MTYKIIALIITLVVTSVVSFAGNSVGGLGGGSPFPTDGSLINRDFLAPGVINTDKFIEQAITGQFIAKGSIINKSSSLVQEALLAAQVATGSLFDGIAAAVAVPNQQMVDLSDHKIDWEFVEQMKATGFSELKVITAEQAMAPNFNGGAAVLKADVLNILSTMKFETKNKQEIMAIEWTQDKVYKGAIDSLLTTDDESKVIFFNSGTVK